MLILELRGQARGDQVKVDALAAPEELVVRGVDAEVEASEEAVEVVLEVVVIPELGDLLRGELAAAVEQDRESGRTSGGEDQAKFLLVERTREGGEETTKHGAISRGHGKAKDL